MPKRKRRLLVPSGLLSLCLLVLLSGCATPINDTPPSYLLEDCVAVRVNAATNADLLDIIDNQRRALRACNDDKAALREWAASKEAP